MVTRTNRATLRLISKEKKLRNCFTKVKSFSVIQSANDASIFEQQLLKTLTGVRVCRLIRVCIPCWGVTPIEITFMVMRLIWKACHISKGSGADNIKPVTNSILPLNFTCKRKTGSGLGGS